MTEQTPIPAPDAAADGVTGEGVPAPAPSPPSTLDADAAQPEVPEADTTPAAAAEPEAAQPEPDAAQPEVPEADTTPAAAAEPDAAQPEAAQPEAAQPEAAQPEAAEPAPAAPAAPAIAVPSPAEMAAMVHPRAPAVAVPAPLPASESARFGRVDEEGRVFVRVGEDEREVGSYPGASPDEALQYFARKYDELVASADLLLQRMSLPDVPAKEIADGLATLKGHLADAKVVGDLEALDTLVAGVEVGLAGKRETEAAERARARAAATAERERIVSDAERIAAQPPGSTQWKTSGEQMRALLDEWKAHQRRSPKLEKATETELWHRFSHARNTFDKNRRSWFAQLESSRSDAKSTKESLVREAEALATSRDWGPTARAFKGLMDQWRQAGRASRSDDDALWDRFKGAQDAFFAAKDAIVAAEEQEFQANLAVKEQLIAEAEAILPVTDLETARAALRVIQDKWDKAGKVPRADMERTEKAMRRVESAVRDADDKRWERTNPEVTARAQSMLTQLEAKISSLSDEVAAAEAAGDAARLTEARAQLQTQEEWLVQVRAGLGNLSG